MDPDSKPNPRTFSLRAIVSRARASAARTLEEAAKIMAEETATKRPEPPQNPRSEDAGH